MWPLNKTTFNIRTIVTIKKMNQIPIIDFSLSSGDISEQVKSALANIGFFYIVNHGVDMSKVK